VSDEPVRIYLHFLDQYHYARAIKGGRVSESTLAVEARRAFRLAVLHANHLYLPASSYFEGRLAQIVLGDHSELSQLGVVYLAASQASLEEHREAKMPQYPDEVFTGLPGAYQVRPHIEPPPYRQRSGSSRSRITDRWLRRLDGEEPQRAAFRQRDLAAARRIEKTWGQIPDLLESRAFVTPHVAELLRARRAEVDDALLAGTIEPPYIEGYAGALDASVISELVYLRSPYPIDAPSAFGFAPTVSAFTELELVDLLDRANVNELLRFRDSSEWRELSQALIAGEPLAASHYDLARSGREVAGGKHRFPAMGNHEAQIGIVTVLPEEFAAMRQMLEPPHKTIKPPNDPYSYLMGSIPATRDGQAIGEHRVVLTELRRMGNASAAASVANLFRSFPSVRLVLMVGIACGVPRPDNVSKHVRLGDVVVSDRRGVVDFTAGVQKDGRVTVRHALPQPSPTLISALNLLDADAIDGKAVWGGRAGSGAPKSRFDRPAPRTDVLLDPEGDPIDHPDDPERVPGEPRVFRGVIGSSNLLVRDPDFRDRVAREHDLRAIEMEGSGVADASWDHGVPYGVVRGVCDYGDGSKDDVWHAHASWVAAAYARALIEHIAPEDLRPLPASGGG
jgi:nucleoside phosphorylase